MSNALTREQLVSGAHGLTEVEVDNIGGGGIVHVRPVSVASGFDFWRDADEIDPDDPDQNLERMVKAIVKGVVDEDGNRLLSDDDREAIMEWPIGDFQKIATAVMQTSALTAESEEIIEGN